MTKTLDAKTNTLGKQTLRSSWEHETVHDAVESWNWNLNVFEIYDLIRDWDNSDKKNVLRYAYRYFNKDPMINELHSFLIGWGIEDD